MTRRRINPLTVYGVPRVGGGVMYPISEYQWFVDYNWDKGFGTGRTQDKPLKDINEAIYNVVSGRGDTIYVGAGGAPQTEAVTFNKAGMSVIAMGYGMNRRTMGEYFSLYSAASYTDGPVATITEPCYIDGLGFASRDTGALFFSGAAVLIGGAAADFTSVYGAHMNNCRFPKWGLSNRIGLSIAGGQAVSNCLIENCEFEGAFETGIYVQGAVGHLQVKDCSFDLPTWSITHGAFSDAGVNTQMKYGPGNVTVSPTKFFKSNSNVGKGNIFGNFYGTAVDTATNDLSVADLLTAGWTCAGNNYQSEDPGPT